MGGRRVYPRVYGGTADSVVKAAFEAGLSPRVRGNLMSAALGVIVVGSIPACTGEPPVDHALVFAQQVYPRVYGGTGGSSRP